MFNCIRNGSWVDEEMNVRVGKKSAQTANPVQTTGIFRVEKGFPAGVVDAGNPLQYDDFPLGRALSSAG
jgi:hypothetical protein